MKDLSKYSKKIQKYLANELSSSEMVEFELLVKSHPELQEEIQLYRKVSKAIADPTIENFKKELETIHNQNFGAKIKKTFIFSQQWYLGAAIILILITLTSIFLFQKNEVNTQDVFEKYFHTLVCDNSRNINDVIDAFKIAIENYNSEDYKLALIQFNDVVKADHDNYLARFYLGVCGLELGEYKIAEIQFKAIIESRDPFYMRNAEWYLALLYLKIDQIEKAKSHLKSIHEKGGMFAIMASLVLDELE